MNRRSFFKKAALGAAVVAIAPAVLSEPFMPQAATIGEYNNYANFSDMTIAQSMDETIMAAAVELGHRAGQSINDLWAVIFDGENRAQA